MQQSPRPSTSPSPSTFAWAWTAVVVVLTIPRLVAHELWRDEAWLWLVATQASSFESLVEPLTRSGQGYLFPLLCFLAAQLSAAPEMLQALNLVVVGGIAFVVLRWSPFAPSYRVLLVFGYLLGFEYAVFSRHYALGVLLLFVACAGWRSPHGRLIVPVSLALACQTTPYAWIVAAALGMVWIGDPATRPVGPRAWVGALLVFGSGAVAGLVQFAPAPGTSFAPGWRLGWEPVQALAVAALPWRAMVPVPRLELHFWGSNILDRWPILMAGLGLASLALVTWVLRHSRPALWIWSFGAVGLVAFAYVKYLGLIRHQGHLFVLLVAAAWVGRVVPPPGTLLSRLVVFVLALHVAANAFASAIDLRHPFSNGSATAMLLRELGVDQLPLLGHREPPAATVALFLGRPLYSPSRERFVTHPDWGPEQRETTFAEVRCRAHQLAHREESDVVLVMTRPLPAWPEVELLGSRTGAILPTEDYHLYRLRGADLPASFPCTLE